MNVLPGLLLVGSAWLFGACATVQEQPPAEPVSADVAQTAAPELEAASLPVQTPDADPPWTIQRHRLPETTPPGLSGLATDETGQVWALPERARVLLPLSPDWDGVTVGKGIPIEDVPDGMDLESLASLGHGLFAAGTELHLEDRSSDSILFLQNDGSRVKVVERVQLSYAPWGFKAESNKGIEALCAVGPYLLMGVETVGQEAGKRFAPLALYHREQKRWVHTRLWLATGTGKLSSLDCFPTADGRGLLAYGIERHFGVGRILRFELPLSDAGLKSLSQPGAGISAELKVDLATLVSTLPNLEGLLRPREGRYLLINDNQSRGVVGAAELWGVRENH